MLAVAVAVAATATAGCRRHLTNWPRDRRAYDRGHWRFPTIGQDDGIEREHDTTMGREIAADERLGAGAAGRRIQPFNMAVHTRSLGNREPVVDEHGVGERARNRLPYPLHRRAPVEKHVQWTSSGNNYIRFAVGGFGAAPACRQHRDEQRCGDYDGTGGHGFFVPFFAVASLAASVRSVAADSCSVATTLPLAASTFTSSTPFLPGTVKSYE